MRRVLRRVGFWFLRRSWKGRPVVHMAVPIDEVYARTVELVEKASLLKDVSSEYRRHWVYAKLKKRWPLRSDRELCRMIEAAVM